MRKSTKKKIMAIAISLAFTASIATTAISFIFPNENQNNQSWAARLSIVIFGQLQTIPAGVGITNNQTADKLYTLNNNNIIYKNSTGDVTLKDFFDVWGENFNSTCILDYCDNGNNSMIMYVNGVANTDYELYVIQNQDDIIIDYR
jgi:hypothetical protein